MGSPAGQSAASLEILVKVRSWNSRYAKQDLPASYVSPAQIAGYARKRGTATETSFAMETEDMGIAILASGNPLDEQKNGTIPFGNMVDTA